MSRGEFTKGFSLTVEDSDWGMVGLAGCHVNIPELASHSLGHSLGCASHPAQEIKPAVVYGGTPMSKDKEMLKDGDDVVESLIVSDSLRVSLIVSESLCFVFFLQQIGWI